MFPSRWKLATYAVDDPIVDGVACHFTVPERGGVKGWLGIAEEVSDISLDGHTAIITGVESLSGAPVMASDLRASAKTMFSS